ncbi:MULTISPECIES: hypothetical protein [Herpetosiphon]|uniref:hypothetical protein n=1 Tax=Herpetosiphon TaxID=64 RepID=UPI001959BA83|nr:hypothetical protein [Herpetosiphon giganteus]MBM7844134.1 hypothetical protein [Herpetosiphon giganteus]
MTNAAYTRLKPQIITGRRILLTAFVTPNDDYFEPPDGWIDPIEVALYGNSFGCNLATPNGNKRYIDSYNRDEVLWTTNSLMQNCQLRPDWGYSNNSTLDLNRLSRFVSRFTKACVAIYRHNHPPVTVGMAIIPAQGLQLLDPQTNSPFGPLVTQARVVAQTALEPGADERLLQTIRDGLLSLAGS